MTAAACSDAPRPEPPAASPTASLSRSSQPLTVRFVALQSDDKRYTIHADYPQLAGGGDDLTLLNDALKDAFSADMADIVKSHEWDDQVNATNTVLYDAMVSKGGSVTMGEGYVSVIGPVEVVPPMSSIWHYWRSLTLSVPDGIEILLDDLFVNPQTEQSGERKAPKQLIEQTAHQLDDLLSECGGSLDPELFGNLSTYGTFAITGDALVIAFSKGTISPMACGAPEIRIPWVSLDDALTDLGRRYAGR
jgi:hypothetical protein